VSIGHSHSEAWAACHGVADGKKKPKKTTRLCGAVFLETNSLSVSRFAIFFSLTLNGLRHKDRTAPI
jgi:hypothetical protein